MPKTTMTSLTFKPVYDKVLNFITDFEDYSMTKKSKVLILLK